MQDNECLPLLLHDDEDTAGSLCFFAGAAPEGVRAENSGLFYLTTVPLWLEPRRASIFIPGYDGPTGLDALSGEWQTGGLEVVVHDPRPRATGDGPSIGFSSHAWSVSDPRADEEQVDDGDVRPFGGSKVGGAPAFLRFRPDIDEPYRRSLKEGFRLLLQLDWPELSPNAQYGPDGNWPFGNGRFFLMIKPGESDRAQYRWLWQL